MLRSVFHRWSYVRRYCQEASMDAQVGFLRFIRDKIRLSGPMTIADYMRVVQTKPDVGYYMSQPVFGAKGDFITSPELSQMFGELMAVWTVAELDRLGHRGNWQLIELGPGTGAMMGDILTTMAQLKTDFSSLSVQMVEVSKKLAERQGSRLCLNGQISIADKSSSNAYQQGLTVQNCPISWHSDMRSVPRLFSMVIAHEFFDALPIHKFQKSPKGWREVLVDFDQATGNLKFVLSSVETLSQRAYLTPKILAGVPSSVDHLEICPGALVYMESLTERLNTDGGAMLIIDYGHTGDKGDTFRGFRSHKVVQPLEFPGICDVTADVNFSMLKEAVKDKLMVIGPLNQCDFLKNLGIDLRLDRLLAKSKTDQEKDYLRKSYEVLTSNREMGSRFKVLGLYPKVLERFPQLPKAVGFF